MFNNIGNKLNNNFLFGIGGIGDLLLLLSTNYYDDLNELGLVFWANNPIQIAHLINECFPKIKNKLITKNYLNTNYAKEYYNQLINDKNFLSKAHIPDNLNYINEWKNINNVFKQYNIQKYPNWINNWKEEKQENIIICPTGGSSDKNWKLKYIEENKLLNIIEDINKNELAEDKIIIISTRKEIEEWYTENFINKLLSLGVEIKLDLPYKEIFKLIINAWKVYSVDSWYKILSRLANIDTILIKSIYLKSLKEIFNLDIDPADNIFISKEWNFLKVIEQ